MHNILLPDQLEARAKALGLWPARRLAEIAGVHRTTLSRAIAGDASIRLGTLQALTQALITRELALRDHLVALHGVPGAGGEAIASASAAADADQDAAERAA